MKYNDNKERLSSNLCECGCGEHTNIGTKSKIPNRFILGHHQRLEEYKEIARKTHTCNTYMLGHHHSEETKNKIADKGRGRHSSPETREKLRIINLGNKHGLGIKKKRT